MRMYNKIFTIIWILCLMVSLAACGQQADSTGQTQETASPAGQNAETTAETAGEESGISGIVTTTAGKVQGTWEDGIYRYLGIPYAQATERFVMATEVEPWDGILIADEYGATSPQGSMLGFSWGSETDGSDNNCQNLNIWTPDVNDGEARPVMVWLHGGGFSTGSANEEDYDGEALSRSGGGGGYPPAHRQQSQ